MNFPTSRTIRIEPYSKNSEVQPLECIDFYFPTSGYLDLSTLLMYFKIRHSSTATSSTHALQRETEHIIDTLEVYVNNEPVNIIKNYNQIFNVICRYGFTIQDVLERQSQRITLLNGNPGLLPSNAFNGHPNSFRESFCCKKWLGFLGCKEIIDLSKNKIHVRITLSDRFIIIGPNPTDTYSLSNIFMTGIHYEKYNKPLKTHIEYDEYKSIYTSLNSTASVEVPLKFISDNVSYAVATFYDRVGHKTVASNLSEGHAIHFLKVNYTNGFNFSVNGKNMYDTDVSPEDIQMIMTNIFKEGCPVVAQSLGTMAGPGSVYQGGSARYFHAGCLIDMKLDNQEELEITFKSRHNNPITTSPFVHFFMYVKLNKIFT